FESLVGAKKDIIHLYNSTSPAQRRVVFGMSKEEILQVAVRGAKWIQERLPRLKGTEVRLQYSPESFSATEVEFAKEAAEAVMAVWKPTPQHKMILNLPDTVEVATPKSSTLRGWPRDLTTHGRSSPGQSSMPAQ